MQATDVRPNGPNHAEWMSFVMKISTSRFALSPKVDETGLAELPSQLYLTAAPPYVRRIPRRDDSPALQGENDGIVY